MKQLSKALLLALAIVLYAYAAEAQRSIYEPANLDEVTYSFEDFGTMWTLDNVPLEEYQKELGFKPSDAWLEDVQKSALQFGRGCSGSFVSEDGLIMTNHHCIRGRLSSIQQKGENLFKNGYYAKTMEDERRFPGLYVDQLMRIEDVTEAVHRAMSEGKTEEEQTELKAEKIEELEKEYEKETGLTCRVVTLYNGGKYSMYIYKRYNDIRLVFAPDVQIAATGWDWDNFTYPRYELDFAFLRAYDESGNPVKVDHYFTWAKEEAKAGEASFVIGRPGNTDRLFAVRQLEYLRDQWNNIVLQQFNQVYQAYYKFFEKHPERRSELLSRLLSVANGRKAYAGMQMGLKNEYLIKKKRDFEKSLKEKVKNTPELQAEYGDIWEKIEETINQTSELQEKRLPFYVSTFYQSAYHRNAQRLAQYALEMERPKNERDEDYRKPELSKTQARIFRPVKEAELQKYLVAAHEGFLREVAGEKCKFLETLYANKEGAEGATHLLNKTRMDEKNYVNKLIDEGAEAIRNAEDPLLQYFLKTQSRMAELDAKRKQLNSRMDVLNQELGRLIYEVYGNKIAPDATSTLRISHGKLKGYKYNGTLAPAKTTFYGLWDRYHSFGEDPYPWGLHERWQEVPEGLNLSAPIGFATTNDIVGGNSGSAVVNKDAEVIGLIHDGNIESLAGDYAFLPGDNRAVASDAIGMLEALKHVYETDRLIYELQNSKMQ